MSLTTMHYESPVRSIVAAYNRLVPRAMERVEREEAEHAAMKKAIADTAELYPEKAIKRPYKHHDWTQDETELCVAMREDGKPWKDVAKALGISACACKGRYWAQKRKGKL